MSIIGYVVMYVIGYVVRAGMDATTRGVVYGVLVWAKM